LNAAIEQLAQINRLARFRQFCAEHQILPLTWPVLDRAAQIWAELRRSGRLIGEVDILTAGMALEYRMALATRNTEHFQRVEGLVVENWAAEQ
jgi:predicted nucleic acid-binding protein